MSGWYCAKTAGRDTVADFYLRRAGLDVFRPEIHRYFRDRFQREKCRISGLIPGYVFVALGCDAEIGKAMNAIGVKYLLGSHERGQFVPKEMPRQWITDLIDAGPTIVGKKAAFKKGAKVKRAIGKLADVFGEVGEELDRSGRVKLYIEMFGSTREVAISSDHLELAD